MVAIGAFAGGLNASHTLLMGLPAASGMAFVLVQHLDPPHPSMMVELLSRHVGMSAVEAVDGARLEPDHVYVIPPGRYISVNGGVIRLSRGRGRATVRMSLDVLLQSMAPALGERAICVILSGTATDGSVGAIVQRLADLKEVSVKVESREGGGSVFSIEVPLSPPGASPAPPVAEPGADAPTAWSGSILVVEDDPALRESLDLFLRAEGHGVSVAADGDEAMRLVEQGGLRPDLVIVGYNLPGEQTALQVLARLCEMLGHGLPALVLTGDISTETLRVIAAQGYEQRTKPVAAEDLKRIITRLLSERAAPTAQSSAPGAVAADGPIVFLIDDDHAVRETMRDLLRANGHLVEDYASAEAFLDSYRPGDEGLLLVDAVMPGMDGFALLDRLAADGRPPPAIVITGQSDVGAAIRALRAGAADFIEKPVSATELLACIDRASERMRRSSAPHAEAATRLATLTARQRRVLDMILAGQRNKNIAADLGISQRTVEAHRAAIMRKTGCKSLSELVRVALAAT